MSTKLAEFFQKRFIELTGLVIIFVSIIFFTFLINYSPVTTEILKHDHNFFIFYIKIYGIFLSDLFLQSFGLAAFLFPLCCTVWGLKILYSKILKNIIIKICLLINSAIFLAISISFYKNDSFWLFYNGNGGFLGKMLKEQIVNYFNLLEIIWFHHIQKILKKTLFNL